MLDGECSSLGTWSAAERDQGPSLPAGLTCIASGGVPVGRVEVSEPLTLCCTGTKP
jgi:hypothetical protein